MRHAIVVEITDDASDIATEDIVNLIRVALWSNFGPGVATGVYGEPTDGTLLSREGPLGYPRPPYPARITPEPSDGVS